MFFQVYITGGFRDKDGTQLATEVQNIYQLVPNSHFRRVAVDETAVGGSFAAVVPQNLTIYP